MKVFEKIGEWFLEVAYGIFGDPHLLDDLEFVEYTEICEYISAKDYATYYYSPGRPEWADDPGVYKHFGRRELVDFYPETGKSVWKRQVSVQRKVPRGENK